MNAKNGHMIVTSALPYANGEIHLGHILEAIQADIWVRFQRAQGYQVHFVCGSDAHGTPVMLAAKDTGQSPKDYAAAFQAQHQKTYRDFQISYDNYYSTHSPENKALVTEIYSRLKESGKITSRMVKQFYDEQEGMFLTDRMIRGTCPECRGENQYGDNCELCGATYESTDLVDPFSTLSNTPPVLKETEHIFFKLSTLQDEVKEWLAHAELQDANVNKLNEWAKGTLQDWDISRDSPYFGFEIPDEPGKYFYVWLDAPIGYMASLQNLADRCKLPPLWPDLRSGDRAEEPVSIYHFVGKDIIYFHALFWPAVLGVAQFQQPTGVFAHGFLSVQGEKMSKSRGTFINANEYLDIFSPEPMRYYFASRLTDTITDIDFDVVAFVEKYNADIVGKFVNLAARAAPFLASIDLTDYSVVASDDETFAEITRHYSSRNFAKAIRLIMEKADAANKTFNDLAPWQHRRLTVLPKDCAQGIVVALYAFRELALYLQPTLPALTSAARQWLEGTDTPWEWDISSLTTPLNITSDYQPLTRRLKLKDANKLVTPTESRADPESQTSVKGASTSQTEKSGLNSQVDIKEFAALDLRVATVLAAEHVADSDKLLKLQLDLGECGQRTVFSGISQTHKPAELVNRQVIAIANLKPRKMRFGISEGMVLAAAYANGASGPKLLGVESEVPPGTKVT